MRIFMTIGLALAIVGAVVYAVLESSSTSASTPYSVSWYSFDEGLAEASKQQKKLLVDVYTDWCSWCKKMDNEVYSDKRIIELLHEHFVSVKLNAESSRKLTYNGQQFTEREFAAALGIDGYPTTVFFLPDAKPITRVPGFMEAKTFANVLVYIGGDHYLSTSYDDFLLKHGSTQ